jgi:hypothetical protein
MRCHRDEDTIFAALSRKRNFCGKLGHLKQNMTQQGGPSSLRFIEKKIPPLSPSSQNEAPIPPSELLILYSIISAC